MKKAIPPHIHYACVCVYWLLRKLRTVAILPSLDDKIPKFLYHGNHDEDKVNGDGSDFKMHVHRLHRLPTSKQMASVARV